MEIVLGIAVLIFSVICHEVAHGLVAERLGDPTARIAGRLTLNPVPHIDLFGSVLLPAICLISGTGILFGWAKPVPVDARFLPDPRKDLAKVALAGPATNIALAVAFAALFRIGLATGLSPAPAMALFATGVTINVVLAVFNLLPIPPLDGAKVLAGVVGGDFARQLYALERYGILIIAALLLAGGLDFVGPVVAAVARALTGAGPVHL